MNHIRQKAAQGLELGDTFTVARTFTEKDTEIFGDITRDYNPVHYDQEFAAAKGLSGLICHGLLTGSMLCEVGGQVGWLAAGMEFKFLKPVYFGDTITCSLEITQLDENRRAQAQVEFRNQDGLLVVSAVVTGQVPGPDEQRILTRMMEDGDPTNKLA